MKIRRRTNRCLNCERSIEVVYNFCPNCGQENTNRYVTFKDLIREFFNNYLSFDSKFGRSIHPFFLRPGKLTNEFIIGKRVNYANPIRLYLIISLFHFFALSQLNTYKNQSDERGKVNFSFDKEELSAELNKIQLDSLNTGMDSIAAATVRQVLDSAQSSLLGAADTIGNERDLIELIPEEANIYPFESKEQILLYYDLRDDLSLTDQQVYDSLHVSPELGYINKAFLRQLIRITRATAKEMTSYLIDNMPILMFILLPIFALLLKFLYIRRNKYYIMHLVHSLHLHSFAFLMLGIAATVGIFSSSQSAGIAYGTALVLILLYVYISFKSVYQQGYFKTFLKYCIYNFIYLILMAIGLTMQSLIALAFY